MKNIIFIAVALLIVFFTAFALILYVPVGNPFTKGSKTYYRVDEGVVDVFGARNGDALTFEGSAKAGESITVSTLSSSADGVPFWLEWLVPAVTDGVDRARYYMYKEAKKTKRREFTVEYTNETIRTKGFLGEIERSKFFKNVTLQFFPETFIFYAKILGTPITLRGSASTARGAEDKLFLKIEMLQVGKLKLPQHILRAFENLFLKAYVRSGNAKIKMERITFAKGKMTMDYRKSEDTDRNIGI